jgi:hypothetical protein
MAQAIPDSGRLLDAAVAESGSLLPALESCQSNCSDIYDDLRKRREALDTSKLEREYLSSQLQLVEGKQETLLSSIGKLRGKSETLRVRSGGAVCRYHFADLKHIYRNQSFYSSSVESVKMILHICINLKPYDEDCFLLLTVIVVKDRGWSGGSSSTSCLSGIQESHR